MVTPPRNENLSFPLLEKTIQAYKFWHGLYFHLPKSTKYSLGVKIDLLLTELIDLLLTAGYAPREQKLIVIQKLSSKLDTLKFFVRVAWEIKSINDKQYMAFCVPLNEIGRMIGGWQNDLKTKQPALLNQAD